MLFAAATTASIVARIHGSCDQEICCSCTGDIWSIGRVFQDPILKKGRAGARYQIIREMDQLYGLIIFLFHSLPLPSVDLELVQVQILFRHGARAPFHDSPDSPDIWATHLRADLTNAPSIELRDVETFTPVHRSVLHDSSNNDGKRRKSPFALCGS